MTKTETESKTDSKTKPTETKSVETKPETKSKTVNIDGYTDFPKTITTAELSVIVSDVTGTDYDGRKIRSVLRRIIPTDGYTKYRFDYPSKTVRRIVGRFVEIENERSTKRKRSTENRKRNETKSTAVIEIDDTGNVSTKTESKPKPKSDKTE